MEQIDPGPVAKKPPARPRRPWLFYAMVAMSLSAVSATVLLSNDMKHLRSLLKAADIDLPVDEPVKPQPVKPVVKAAPPPPKTIPVNPRLFLDAEPNIASGLRRIWQMTGPDMCKTLRSSGVDMSEWKAAAIGAQIFECSFEKIYRKEGERTASSLFVMVRGDTAGRITSMRVKLVDPPRQAGGDLDPALVTIFDTMLTQSRWGDFGEQLTAIRKLRDIRKEGFGAAMSFTREFDDDRNYNFLLTLRPKTADQRRMNDLFQSQSGFNLLEQPDYQLFQDPQAPPAPGVDSMAPQTDLPGAEALPRAEQANEPDPVFQAPTEQPGETQLPRKAPPSAQERRDSIRLPETIRKR